MYPKKLANHSIETFRLEEKNLDQPPVRRTYFHTNDYPINMHSHNFYEINIIVEGTGAHYIENICIPIKPGDVFAIPPSNRHGYWADTDDLKIFHLILPHYVLEKYEDELAKFPGYSMLFEIEPLLRKNNGENLFLHLSEDSLKRLLPEMENLIYNAQQEECEETNLLFEIRSVLLICTLARLINKENKRLPVYSETTQADSLSIVKTIEYMHQKYSEKISINELAKMANMSRSTYLRRFILMCRQTPMDYLCEVRVKKACQMMKNGNLTITEIAQNCGFFDCSHFIRVFTKLRGTTPNAYRKNILSRF